MPYSRFVEIGRVALVSYGPDRGKLCTILDVVDQTTVLVDGPSTLTGVHRQVINLKWLSLTNFKVVIGRGARLKSLVKAFTKAKTLEKWNKSAWAKTLAQRKKRASLSDFDRFKVMVFRKKRSQLVHSALKKLKKAYNEKKKAAPKKEKGVKAAKTEAPKAAAKPAASKAPVKAAGKAAGKAVGKAAGKAVGKAVGKATGKAAGKPAKK